MSLPSGYARLEYIQSSGTQWVDTGVYAKGNQTKVVADVDITYGSSWTMILGSYNSGAYFSWWGNGSALTVYYGSSNQQQAGMVGRGVLTADKAVWSYGETSMTFTESAFTASSTMYLFSINVGGNYANASMKLYSCKIYDNGVLVRDYIPCKNASGAVGLYDMVGSQFYGNAGTGSFTAGPEVQQGPETPESFTAEKTDDTHFTLSWSAVEDASGYKVYRDGTLAATQTATSYTAAVTPFQSATFAVTAYNGDGESDPATLTVRNRPDDPTLWLITDRTQADVDALNALLAKPMSQWTAAERAALLGGMKGGYFAADLNRVSAAVAYLAERLHGLGYAVTVSVKQDWANSDDATDEDMEVYRDNVAALRAVLAVFSTTPDTPEDLVKLTWREANDIEQVLVDVDRLITNLEQSWYYSGEVYAGEI